MTATPPRTPATPPVSTRVMNLGHLLRQAARRLPDAPGLVHGEAVIPWAVIDAGADGLAAGLAAMGVARGDRVLAQSRNCLAMVQSMFACFRLGAVWCPANFRQTPEEVAGLARLCGAAALICHADFPAHAAAVRAAVPGLAVAWIGTSPAAAPGDEEAGALIARHGGATGPEAAAGRDDPAWLFFTSGTTGRPKAAILTHGQMGFVVTNHLADLMPGLTERDASLVVAPLSHGAGVHLLVQVARGVPSVLLSGERFDPAEAWALVERWRVSNLFTVPTILKLLVEHPAVHRHDRSSLRHVIYAGAPMYREDQRRALATLGPVLVQYFGLGEVTGAITVLRPDLHDPGEGEGARPGTCGLPRTAMQVSIQDEGGRELPPGETGEILVTGPAVFAGYFNDDEANAKAFRDGWFRTGDLGHADAEGFVYITGRASDMYISGGSNIHPREIEEKLLTHPGVGEAAVFGVPDPVWGEAGVAVIVARDGAALDEGEVLAWLAGRVARYKLPRRAFLRPAIPKSAYGKVTRKGLRAELEAAGLLPLTGAAP